MTNVRLVYLESSGNQSFVFGTNKLSEVVGASELLHRVGTSMVGEAVLETFGRVPAPDLLNEPVIGSPAARGVEVLLATSGKAMLLVEEGKARSFVTAWSRRVATDAPGVDATAVFSGPFDMGADGGLHGAVSEVHRSFESARLFRTSPAARFARLPHIAECRTSGWPAAGLDQEGSRTLELSSVSLAKRKMARDPGTARRLSNLATTVGPQLSANLDGMEKALEKEGTLGWLAVVHADGNGLGELFMNLHAHVKAMASRKPGWWSREATQNANRAYLETYRRFSLELDEVSRLALRKALGVLRPVGQGKGAFLPLVPIVFGGDDLTVLVDGKQALRFAEAYVKAFAQGTGDASSGLLATPALLAAAQGDLGGPRLGMSAGVSITKPHFPFSTSYALAEQLLKSAKVVKRTANRSSSSLDFHILYDSSATTIEEIRAKLQRNGVVLSRKPFVLDLSGSAADPGWCASHDWQKLEAAVAALAGGSLPSSHAHVLRTALRDFDPPGLERELALLGKRYAGFGRAWGGRLFEATPPSVPGTGVVETTLFLDAIEAKDFLGGGPAGPASPAQARPKAVFPTAPPRGGNAAAGEAK